LHKIEGSFTRDKHQVVIFRRRNGCFGIEMSAIFSNKLGNSLLAEATKVNSKAMGNDSDTTFAYIGLSEFGGTHFRYLQKKAIHFDIQYLAKHPTCTM
jgi:hypothetical protein